MIIKISYRNYPMLSKMNDEGVDITMFIQIALGNYKVGLFEYVDFDNLKTGSTLNLPTRITIKENLIPDAFSDLDSVEKNALLKHIINSYIDIEKLYGVSNPVKIKSSTIENFKSVPKKIYSPKKAKNTEKRETKKSNIIDNKEEQNIIKNNIMEETVTLSFDNTENKKYYDEEGNEIMSPEDDAAFMALFK